MKLVLILGVMLFSKFSFACEGYQVPKDLPIEQISSHSVEISRKYSKGHVPALTYCIAAGIYQLQNRLFLFGAPDVTVEGIGIVEIKGDVILSDLDESKATLRNVKIEGLVYLGNAIKDYISEITLDKVDVSNPKGAAFCYLSNIERGGPVNLKILNSKFHNSQYGFYADSTEGNSYIDIVNSSFENNVYGIGAGASDELNFGFFNMNVSKSNFQNNRFDLFGSVMKVNNDTKISTKWTSSPSSYSHYCPLVGYE